MIDLLPEVPYLKGPSAKTLRRRWQSAALYETPILDMQRQPLQQAFTEAVIDMSFSHPEFLSEAQEAIVANRHIRPGMLKALRTLYPSRIAYIDKRSQMLLHHKLGLKPLKTDKQDHFQL